MCCRLVLPDGLAVERFWKVDRNGWQPASANLFNVTPTSEVPVVILADDGSVELTKSRWGFIPSWWMKAMPPSMTFNARSEEAAQKPFWRKCLQTHRCMLLVRGWYEWDAAELVKADSGRRVRQPYFFHSPGREIIALAGLWDIWLDIDGNKVVSCAIMTKEALPELACIHHRMPVVLREEHYRSWIEKDYIPERVKTMIQDSRDDIEMYPVSFRVNDARNNYPELIERADANANANIMSAKQQKIWIEDN